MSSDTQGLKIWGRRNSINVMKVLWGCEELGLPYEQIDVGGAFGGNNTPEYLAMNPNGKVPVLQDGDFTLWESHAIVRYLAFKFGNPGLFPKDIKVRFLAEQWMDWAQTTPQAAIGDMFWSLVRKDPNRTPEMVAASRKASREAFAILEAHMAGRAFVTGDEFTMGDIPIAAITHRWMALDAERPATPNLDAYIQRLKERPGYTQHVALPLT